MIENSSAENSSSNLLPEETFQIEKSLLERSTEIIKTYFPLSLSSFGGPQAHIALFHDAFVDKLKWFNDQTFSEIFAIASSLPGPSSTQMGYSFALLRGGVFPGLLGFLIWSVPCMLVMTAFGISINYLPKNLPLWLLNVANGLSSAAVGLVAVAGYKLSSKLLVSRFNIILGTLSCCLAINFHQQVWLYPTLMIAGGVSYLIFDYFVPDKESHSPTQTLNLPISFLSGTFILSFWLLLLVAAIIFQSSLVSDKILKLFGVFYFSGSIVFGGGPVIIPLLQIWLVNAGYLTDQEFLIGFALINILPGPNFNLAAYCGALALRGSLAVLGSLIAYVGIFSPGILLMTGILPLWQKYRETRVIKTLLKGITPAAVGLVLASIYLISLKALAPELIGGTPMAITSSPYFLTVSIVTFSAVGFLNVPSPLSIFVGGILGLVYWGINHS